MSLLTDKEIRAALIKALLKRKPAPKAVIEELRVHDGNAVADVVTVHKELHCYEIKGESDKISRLVTQAEYYDKAFRKVTLVTTENHITRAFLIAPPHWGVIVCNRRGENFSLKSIRKARLSPNYCGITALLTLWRSEMLSIGEGALNKPEKLNRKDLALCIWQDQTDKDVQIKIGKALISRLIKDKN